MYYVDTSTRHEEGYPIICDDGFVLMHVRNYEVAHNLADMLNHNHKPGTKISQPMLGRVDMRV